MLYQGFFIKWKNWIEELEKLGNLRDLGILTEERFQAGKKKLLAMRKKSPL